MFKEVTDEQWAAVEKVLPKRSTGRGRPKLDDRKMLNAIIWLFHESNVKWESLPNKYGSVKTVHTRLQTWLEDKTWDKVLDAFWRTWGREERIGFAHLRIQVARYRIQHEMGAKRSRMNSDVATKKEVHEMRISPCDLKPQPVWWLNP